METTKRADYMYVVYDKKWIEIESNSHISEKTEKQSTKAHNLLTDECYRQK
jgi:hypothetical protein